MGVVTVGGAGNGGVTQLPGPPLQLPFEIDLLIVHGKVAALNVLVKLHIGEPSVCL